MQRDNGMDAEILELRGQAVDIWVINRDYLDAERGLELGIRLIYIRARFAAVFLRFQ